MNGFNYTEYLRRRLMIGVFDPFVNEDGRMTEVLLVDVKIALDECNHWSNQDITRANLLKELKDNDILVFGNIEEYINWKKNKDKPRKKHKRVISEERRNALRNHAKEMRDKLRATNPENG